MGVVDNNNNLNDAGVPVKYGSLCIIENSSGELYFVLEKESTRRKKIGHIGIAGGRAENDLLTGNMETPLQTIIREIFQETRMLSYKQDTIASALRQKDLLLGTDIANVHPQIMVTIYSLMANFEPVENEEIKGVVYSTQTIIDLLREPQGYLSFRPVALEALALHFGIDLLDEEKHVLITNRNYTNKPQRIINELISTLDGGKSSKSEDLS